MDNLSLSAQSIPKLVIAIPACNVIGSLGSLVTVTGPGSWYAGLEKPFFSPPGLVFAPDWSTLFSLMVVALYLMWECGTEK